MTIQAAATYSFGATRSSFTAGLAALLASAALPALAQVPSSVAPGKVEQRFETPSATMAPATAPRVQVPSAPATAPRPSMQPFTLNAVSFEGNTVYTGDELTSYAAEYTGKQVTAAEAQAIAAAVTQHYRANGYILSQAVVAGQEGGNLRIRVIEGFIANVIIEGEVRQSSDRRIIEGIAENIKNERPFRLSTLERNLLLLDDLPGATARGVIRPSTTTFGAADLVVNMTHKLWEGSFTTDNRGSEFIGPHQHSVTLAANSLLRVYDRTLLRYVTTSPLDELQFFAIEHEQQLNSNGTRLNINASETITEPSVRPAIPDIDGESTFIQARVSHPFIRSRKENLTGRVLFDYRTSETDLFGVNISNDRIRALRAGAQYDFADRFDGVTLVDGQVSQGLNIANATHPFSSDGSRADATAVFTKFNLDVSRIHQLPYNFSLLTAASGQYSVDNLLPAEQFSVGGVGFGQAYDPAEISGDHGLAGRAELRYGEATDYSYLASYQLFGYYDIGAVWTRGVPDDRESLASTGFGVRANFTPWLSGTAEMGFPLTRDVAAEGDDDPRFFFSVTGRF